MDERAGPPRRPPGTEVRLHRRLASPAAAARGPAESGRAVTAPCAVSARRRLAGGAAERRDRPGERRRAGRGGRGRREQPRQPAWSSTCRTSPSSTAPDCGCCSGWRAGSRDRQQALRLVVPEGARISRVLDFAGVSTVARGPAVLRSRRVRRTRSPSMTARAATSFTVEDTGRAGVVRATGEVDAASSGAFRTALERAVGPRPTARRRRPGAGVVPRLRRAVGRLRGRSARWPVDRELVLGNVPARMLRTLRLAAVPSVVTVHPQGEAQPWAEQAPGGA